MRTVSPIVIAGLPRTGTTFLHRYLHQQKVGIGQTLWEQMFPSRMLRKALHPCKDMLERVSPTRHHQDHIHKTGFDCIETNDAAVLLQYLDGFFLYAFFWAFDDDDHRDFFDGQHRDVSARDFSWLIRCWQHQRTSLSPLAKIFSVGAKIPQFQQYFPAGTIIYPARDPCSVIPSTLSLLTSVLKNRFDWEAISQEKKQRYYDRITDALIELMYRFHIDWSTEKIDRTRCLILPYELLNQDFLGAMEKICVLVKHRPSKELTLDIEQRDHKQKQRKSRHQYKLSTYGLDETEIQYRTRFFLPYWRME